MNVRPRPLDTFPCYAKPEPFDVLADSRVRGRLAQAAREVKVICSACPIRDTCHQGALQADEPWMKALVGLTKPPKKRGAPRTAVCGTPGGWNRHVRDKTPVCTPCREAWNQYRRDYRAKKRAEAQGVAA